MTAPVHDRHATPVPALPPSSAAQNISSSVSGTARNRSGSGTTATSDSSNANMFPRVQGNGSSPSYSNSGSYVHVHPMSQANGNGKSSHAPGSSQSLVPPANGSSALSPIVTRMRERDADAMAKYNMRNRSGSASTDTKSANGSTNAETNGIDSVSSLPPSGASTPRRRLRPSLSAAQLRSTPQPPSIITTSPSQNDSTRSRQGPSSGGSRFSPTSIVSHAFGSRNNSTTDNRRDARALFEVDEPKENLTGPPSRFAQFPDPPWTADSSSSSSTPTVTPGSTRRLPFNLLSKVHSEPLATHPAHRRGSSAGNAIR